MRNMFAFSAVVVAVVGVSEQVQAEEQAQAAVVQGAQAKTWLGGQMGLSPIGSLELSASNGPNSLSASNDANMAFDVGGRIEYRVTPNVSIGATPSILFHVQGNGASNSGTALDLPVRLSVGGDVAPNARLYGFAAPGYSILFPPSDSMGNSVNPSGFMIGLGGGVNYQVAPRLAVLGELGYQWRFLNTEQSGVDMSLQANYLTFTVGLVTPID